MAALIFGSLLPSNAWSIGLNDPAAAAAGGIEHYWDRENTLPGVVSLAQFNKAWNGNWCTGTLINARTVLTAAHCVVKSDRSSLTPAIRNKEQVISFNPDVRGGATAHDRALSGILAHPDYDKIDGSSDIALISLDGPVTGVQPVRLYQPGDPLPQIGSLVTIAGYGRSGIGTLAATNQDSKRRIAQTRLGGLGRTYGRGAIAYGAEFRNPLSPQASGRAPDSEPDIVHLDALGFPVPALQGEPSGGDSGGPLFLVTEQGLIQIGTVIGGDDGYGSVNYWVPLPEHVDWLAGNNPLRSTSAVEGAWNWSDARAWIDTQGRGEVPDNADGNFKGWGTLGRYYEVSLSNASTVDVDVSPTIDSLQVTHQDAELTILDGQELTVLLDTRLSAGELTVSGTLDTGSLLQIGGAVSGEGTIVAPFGFHNDGGVVSPGHADELGTLTVDGDYVQGAAGTLSVRVGATGSDSLAVTGTATLDGTLSLEPFQTAPAVGQSFTVVDAGEVEGDFATLSAALPALTWTRTVTDGQVIVKAGVDYVDDVPNNPAVEPEIHQAAKKSADSLNEIAKRITPQDAREAAASTAIGQTPFPATPALAIAGLNTLNAPALGRALQALPPNGFDGQSAAALQTSRLVAGVLTDRLNELDGGLILQHGFGASTGGSVDAASAPLVNAYAAQKQASETMAGAAGALGALAPARPVAPRTPFGVFVAGSFIRSGPAARNGYNTYGLTAGIDYRAAPGLTFGAALTYADDRRTVHGIKHEGNAVVPTLYGRFSQGRFFVDGYLGYAFGNGDTQRLVAFGNQLLSVRSSPRYGQVLAGAVAGLRLDQTAFGAGQSLPGSLTFTPFVGLDMTQARFDSYQEEGAGALSARVSARHFSEVQTSAGLEASWRVPLSFGVLTPRLKASVTQRFGDKVDTATAAFAAAPDLPFRLWGARDARTYGSFGAALSLQSGEAFSALVSYQADVNKDGLLDNRFSAKVGYRF